MIRAEKFSYFLILILAMSLFIIAQSVSAQSMPKPSVPQFTITFVPSSYSTTTMDPYTGENTTEQYQNNTIQLTIKNQPIPQEVISNGSINLYYNVQTKGHYSNEWVSEYSFPSWASTDSDSLEGNYSKILPEQSNSQYTTLYFQANYQAGDQIDFQVEALFAYENTTTIYYNTIIVPFQVTTFTYQSSGWSTTQTFTMPNTFVVEYFPYIITAIVAIAISLVLVALIFYRRHRKKIPLPN